MIEQTVRNSVFLQLEGIANTDLLRRELFTQETIVITAAPTDTMAMLIKDHTGHQDDINRTAPSRSLRLRHTVTTLTHHILSVIRTDLHRVAMGDRKKKCFLTLILSE